MRASIRLMIADPVHLHGVGARSQRQDRAALRPVGLGERRGPHHRAAGRLSTPVAGIVAEVLVERGDNVRRGDVVARLDATIEEIAFTLAQAKAGNQTRIRSLEARVAFLEAQADRQAGLAERNVVAETVVTEARLEAEVARQELDEARLGLVLAGMEATQAEALLDQKTLRAPIDGVVTERLISPGEFRDTQSHFATLARLDVLRVEAFAPISYYEHLQIGQAVTIRPEDPIGGSHGATITVIDRVFDAATATFGLRMELPNPKLMLPAGLRCEVVFQDAVATVAK
jgi:membrane fusion protein, multidrug efflux system